MLRCLNTLYYILYASMSNYSILYTTYYTLNLKCITSPSFTMYSFPSILNLPTSRAAAFRPLSKGSG